MRAGALAHRRRRGGVGWRDLGEPVVGLTLQSLLTKLPHLLARDYFFTTNEIDTGTRRYDGAPFCFAGERGYGAWRRSPGLGEHNREVLEGIAGLEPSAVDALETSGVIVDRPPV